MIQFDDFVQAVHDAAFDANRAMMDDNLKLLERYFEKSDGAKSVNNSVNKSFGIVKDMLRDQEVDEQQMETILQSFKDVKKALADVVPDNEEVLPFGSLVPKTVAIQYPEITTSGVDMKMVQVPIIALVPVVQTQISEIKVRTNMQIHAKGNKLKVSFDSSTAQNDKKNPETGTQTTLEMTITPNNGPEGLQQIIKGYERVLRAQIPG